MAEAPGSSAEELGFIASFLEAAVHQILYTRGLYPPALFETRTLYGVPVMMSRHPDLNSYIAETVGAARGMLERGEFHALIVAVTDEARVGGGSGGGSSGGGGGGSGGGSGGARSSGAADAGVLERFVLEISAAESAAELGAGLLHEGFRDALLRLSTLRALAPPSATTSFRLVLAAPRAAPCPDGLKGGFVRATDAACAPIPRAAITPLHDVAYPHAAFRMSLRAEEAAT